MHNTPCRTRVPCLARSPYPPAKRCRRAFRHGLCRGAARSIARASPSVASTPGPGQASLVTPRSGCVRNCAAGRAYSGLSPPPHSPQRTGGCPSRSLRRAPIAIPPMLSPAAVTHRHSYPLRIGPDSERDWWQNTCVQCMVGSFCMHIYNPGNSSSPRATYLYTYFTCMIISPGFLSNCVFVLAFFSFLFFFLWLLRRSVPKKRRKKKHRSRKKKEEAGAIAILAGASPQQLQASTYVPRL